ncbi:MAG TPA: PAS domain S-box protein [Opitutaceae bacterium]|nr:PAS domain S-box protein [Opitutaceae bacterium]
MKTPLRALFVEDDPNDATLMVDALTSAGFKLTWQRVETAAELTVALERGPWDVVLCDFTLPEFDSDQALRITLATVPDVPVIVVTGTIGEERLANTMRAGARDFVLKTRLERLAPAVQREVDSARVRLEQRRLEAQLQREQERFRALVEKSPEPLTVIDPRGQVLYASPSAEQAFGYVPGEYAGRSIFDFVHPNDVAPAKRELAAAVQRPDAGFTRELRWVRKDGTRRWIEVSGSNLLEDPAIGGIVLAYRDVTERKSTEEERQQDRQRTEALLELLQSPTRSRDEVVQFTVEQAVAMTQSEFGFVGFVDADETVLSAHPSAAVLSRCGMKARVPIDFRIAHGGLWAAAIRERRPIMVNDYAEANPLKKGVPEGHLGLRRFLAVPVFRAGRAVMLCGLANKAEPYDDSDVLHVRLFAEGVWGVLENNRNQQALRRNERHYRALMEQSLDVVAVLAKDGTVTYQSPSVERVLGWQPADVVGHSVFDFVHPDDRVTAERRFAELPDNAINDGTFRCRHRDGSWRSLDVITRNLLGDPDVAGIVVNARDVTERKALEAQYLHAQRLEAFGQLAGGVAHDFNNILAVMLMDFSLIQAEPDLTPAVAGWVKQLETLANRAAALTRQLLIFGRRQELEIQTLDLNGALENVCGLMRRLIGENITVDFRPAGRPLWVSADRGMIEQVVTNLCVNARDAMPEGGRLSVMLGAESRRPPEADADAAPREMAYLAVADTGCGMTEEVRKRIFEPFFTTKPVGRGTGLGLATVYAIAKQHHGWIDVDTAPGRGSTFRVYFPIVATPPQMEGAQSPRPEPTGGTEDVLLVEDEALVRSTLAMCLLRGGYHVTEARDGLEAKRKWDEAGGNFAVLVTDMVMPEGVTGLQLAKQLLEAKPALHVVIVSGYSAEPISSAAPFASRIIHLAKPCTPEQLLRAVRRAIEAK